LAHLVHKGRYPPRFGLRFPCPHSEKDGSPVCAQREPNVCTENDWLFVTRPDRDQWNTFMQDVRSKNIFDGYMEASAARTRAMGNG
jgi:hypothetical protein